MALTEIKIFSLTCDRCLQRPAFVITPYDQSGYGAPSVPVSELPRQWGYVHVRNPGRIDYNLGRKDLCCPVCMSKAQAAGEETE